MQNDPRDNSGARLLNGLRLLGRDVRFRERIVAFCREVEASLEYEGSCRDDITGPIVDALHTENDEYEKQLVDGTKVAYLYRTKIARDLLFSTSDEITHFWEPQTTKLLIHLSKSLSGDVVIGGAYFGDQAVLVARAVKGQCATVHCFEPNKEQAAMLQKNFQINDLTNYSITEKALWDESDVHMRLDGFDSFANVTIDESGEGFLTETIDGFFRATGGKLGLIQLDIEGSELRALQGAINTLERDRPVVIFELHRSYVDWTNGLASTNICDLFLSRGYQVYALRDVNSHCELPEHKIELVELEHVYLDGPPHGFNMVAFPSASFVEEGPFRIMRDVSPKLLPHKSPDLHHPVEGF